MKPQIVSAEEAGKLRQDKQPKVVDIYESQCVELQKIHNPSGDAASPITEPADAWIYLPWSNVLLHTVNEDDLLVLRTNRNREIIMAEEQQKLRSAVVGIAGMSVGSGIAIALAYSGISRHIKIADFDELDTSNLNRLRESLVNVGRPKAELSAEHIYELDPFAEVDVYGDGLNDENLGRFFDDPKLSVVVDEIDDFKMKIRLRLEAKKRHIPLLMFTSLGDNILIDVERYDLDHELAIFNGELGDNGEEILSNPDITPEDIRKYSIMLVHPRYIPTRALKSVFEMGKTLVGRPQLYSTIAIDGGLGAYVIRQIVLNNLPVSGRYFVKFADFVGIDSQDFTDTDERLEILKRLGG